MGIDDLSAPSGRFLARVTAAVATDDRLRSHGDFFPEADTAFASVFAVPSEGGTGSAEAPATAILSPSMLLPRRAPHSASTPPRSLIWPRPSLRRLSTRHLRLPCCLRATPPLGAAEEQPLPLAPSHLLLIMASGPAGLLVHPLDVLTPRRESHGRDRLCVTPPAPAASHAPTVPIPSGRNHAEPVGTPLLRLAHSPDVPSATTAYLDALAAAAESKFGDSAARYSHAD